MRIKEQETRLTLQEHDDDDDDDNLEGFSVLVISDKIVTLKCVLRGKQNLSDYDLS